MSNATSSESLQSGSTVVPADAPWRPWIHWLAAELRRTDAGSESRLPTLVGYEPSGRQTGQRAGLVIPPEMATLQRDALIFLQHLARRYRLKLIEDRRKVDLKPIAERRTHRTDRLADGIALLLKQIGLPGDTPATSVPHRLKQDAVSIGLHELLLMAAHAREKSKRVVVLPNEALSTALDGDTHPIVARGCQLKGGRVPTTLSQFDAPGFRALGYSAGNQYVIHRLVGAGSIRQPALWSIPSSLAGSRFQFQLYRGVTPADRIGILYSTYYFDLVDIDTV